MSYLGDIRLNSTISFNFGTCNSSGAMASIDSTSIIAVYADDSTTASTAGITFTPDYITGKSGLNHVKIVAASTSSYATATNYSVVINTGAVGGQSVAGMPVAHFSIENRSAVMPTVAGRTLDVSAGGEAGVDWANVGSPTTALNLSGTNIDTDQVVASVTGAVGSVTGAVGSVTGAVGSVTGAVGSVTGNVGGNVVGSVGSVAAGGIATTSFAAGAIDAAAIAANAIGASEIADGAIDAATFAAGAINAAALAADAVDEILDDTIGDGTLTVRQALRIAVAALAGKLSGAATTTVTIRNAADTADVVVATVDANGNRTAITLTP